MIIWQPIVRQGEPHIIDTPLCSFVYGVQHNRRSFVISLLFFFMLRLRAVEMHVDCDFVQAFNEDFGVAIMKDHKHIPRHSHWIGQTVTFSCEAIACLKMASIGDIHVRSTRFLASF